MIPEDSFHTDVLQPMEFGGANSQIPLGLSPFAERGEDLGQNPNNNVRAFIITPKSRRAPDELEYPDRVNSMADLLRRVILPYGDKTSHRHIVPVTTIPYAVQPVEYPDPPYVKADGKLVIIYDPVQELIPRAGGCEEQIAALEIWFGANNRPLDRDTWPALWDQNLSYNQNDLPKPDHGSGSPSGSFDSAALNETEPELEPEVPFIPLCNFQSPNSTEDLPPAVNGSVTANSTDMWPSRTRGPSTMPTQLSSASQGLSTFISPPPMLTTYTATGSAVRPSSGSTAQDRSTYIEPPPTINTFTTIVRLTTIITLPFPSLAPSTITKVIPAPTSTTP